MHLFAPAATHFIDAVDCGTTAAFAEQKAPPADIN
jgi:hypothetical protein